MLRKLSIFLSDLSRAVANFDKDAGQLLSASPKATFHTTEPTDLLGMADLARKLGAVIVTPEQQRVVFAFTKASTGGKAYVSLADSARTQEVIKEMSALGYTPDFFNPSVYIQGQ